MKKSGFSLVEIIVVTAIMGIVMLIFSPMIDAFIGAQDRLYNQSKVDSRLNEVVEFIKRDVRNARSDSNLGGEPVGVFDSDDILITDGSKGKKVIIKTTDLSGNPKFIQYAVDGSTLKLNSTDSFTKTIGSSVVLSNIEMGEFKYQDKVLLFYFKIDLPDRLDGKIRNEVRDVGITRINLQ
ncbi:PulJ/GspJ family protein [Psychrilyobacter atlanticus]|uniref:PulJ/GspJ family protein n=1 Tax=Psychrilyobacter atlanticus TaxID=271091 RepID=UPI0003F84ABC|nr:type II secretion system protein [Psychrilyobacter atlanticus]